MQLDGGLLSDDSTRMPPALWWVQHLGLWRSTPEYWLERAWRAEEKVVAMYVATWCTSRSSCHRNY